MSLWSRFRNAVRPADLDAELQNEVEAHLAQMESEELARGATPREARRRAQRRFGNSVVYRERARDRDLFVWVENLLQDLRFALRQLIAVPGFAITTILLLALGIGVNAAIFTLLNSIVLHSLPLPHPDRLVVMLEEMPAGCCSPPSWLDQKDFRERNHVFESMAAFAYSASYLVTASGETSRVRGGYVTPDYFDTLGAKPIAGRVFTADEGRAGHDAVALLREDYWRSKFNADPAILDSDIVLNGRRSKVIGILPRDFRFPWDTAVVWTPLVPPAGAAANRGFHGWPMVGRLKPGVTLAQATAEMSGIMRWMSETYPDQDTDRVHVVISPLQRWNIGDTQNRLLVLQCAAFAVFLMTCANVSSLLLARYAARRREFALRAALGASTFRQIRQHLAESLLLALIGCLAGAGVAYEGVAFLRYLYGTSLPRAEEIAVDARLVWFTIGVTLIGAIVFGLTTAWHSRPRHLEQVLREGGHSAGSRTGAFARKFLVAVQVASAITLVAAAAQLIRSFERLTSVPTGFETNNLTTMTVTIPDSKYTTSERANGFFQDAVTRLSGLPGVRSAAAINLLPVQQYGYNGSVQVPGLPTPPSSYFVEFRWIAGDYLRTMGIPLVRGRAFLPEEAAGKKGAVIINETMARTLWGTRDPIGWPMDSDPEPARVVGVFRDVRQSGLQQPARPEMLMPLASRPVPLTEQSIVVRSTLPVASLLPLIRREIRYSDPQAAVYRVESMRQVLADSVSYQRVTTTLLGLFAGLALLLAAFGLHGVMSFLVHERMREFAIRLAVGAQPRQLLRMVFGQSLTIVGIGLVLGMGGVYTVTHILPAVLSGVRSVDALSLIASITVLIAAALLALTAPARRATRVDPILMLRQD
jgi:putative ABC transport system permease protein